MTFAIKAPAAPQLSETRTLVTATQGGLWPCRGSQVPTRLLLAALWRHLLASLQSASGSKLSRKKMGWGPADQWGLSEATQAPPGCMSIHSRGGPLPSCKERAPWMEGRARAAALGESEGRQLECCVSLEREHSSIQDLIHTSIIKLCQALDIWGESRQELGGG